MSTLTPIRFAALPLSFPTPSPCVVKAIGSAKDCFVFVAPYTHCLHANGNPASCDHLCRGVSADVGRCARLDFGSKNDSLTGGVVRVVPGAHNRKRRWIGCGKSNGQCNLRACIKASRKSPLFKA